jgi:hypothetical protein
MHPFFFFEKLNIIKPRHKKCQDRARKRAKKTERTQDPCQHNTEAATTTTTTTRSNSTKKKPHRT